MKSFNLKSVALIVFFLGLNQIFAEERIPSVGKRLTNMVEHSFYATAAGASASLVGWVGFAALALQNGTIPRSEMANINNEFHELFITVVKTIAKSPYGPHMVLGVSGAVGIIALYNAYKAGSNFFGIIKDRV